MWTVRIEIIVWRSRILYMSSGTIIMKLWKIIQKATNKTNLWSALQTRKLYWLREAYRKNKKQTNGHDGSFLGILCLASGCSHGGFRWFFGASIKLWLFLLTFTVFRSITLMFDCLLYFFSSINCSLCVLKTLVRCYHVFVVKRFSFVSCACNWQSFSQGSKTLSTSARIAIVFLMPFGHPLDILRCWNSVFDVSWR